MHQHRSRNVLKKSLKVRRTRYVTLGKRGRFYVIFYFNPKLKKAFSAVFDFQICYSALKNSLNELFEKNFVLTRLCTKVKVFDFSDFFKILTRRNYLIKKIMQY